MLNHPSPFPPLRSTLREKLNHFSTPFFLVFKLEKILDEQPQAAEAVRRVTFYSAFKSEIALHHQPQKKLEFSIIDTAVV